MKSHQKRHHALLKRTLHRNVDFPCPDSALTITPLAIPLVEIDGVIHAIHTSGVNTSA